MKVLELRLRANGVVVHCARHKNQKLTRRTSYTFSIQFPNESFTLSFSSSSDTVNVQFVQKIGTLQCIVCTARRVEKVMVKDIDRHTYMFKPLPIFEV